MASHIFKESSAGDAPFFRISFTMVDEYGNIACPNTFGFGSDPYVQSGWSVQSAGQLVYLYPDWDNAIAYNPGSVEGKAGNPWIPHGTYTYTRWLLNTHRVAIRWRHQWQ